jgi:O-antigen/teichoic acid export membrane protein
VLSLICWFFPLTIINSIFAYGLIGIDHKREYLKATTAGFFVNIIVIVTLIQIYGIYGAGIALVAGELAFIILCYHEFRKFCSVHFYLPFIKVCIISAVSYMSVYYIPVHSLVKSVIGAVIFILFSLIVRIIKKNDIGLVKETWNKS